MQLGGLACLVWLSGNHTSPWLAPFPTWEHRAGRLPKYPKAQVNPMYCTGDRVANAKAREAALIGKRLRNTDFSFSADPVSMYISSPHAYLLLFFFLKPCHVEFTPETDSNNEKSCYRNRKGGHNSTSQPKCCLTANCLPVLRILSLKHPTTDWVAQPLPHVSIFVRAQDPFASPLTSRERVTVSLRALWQ